MLETIYEVDENISSDDDSSKFTEKQSRLPYYICWCMMSGCFLMIILAIVISLNPLYLSNNLINKNSENILNIPLNLDDKLELSTKIINHLNKFSQQINEQLDLQPNTITFFTSNILNSSLEIQNNILSIYGHLKYPQLCIDNIQCKKNFHLKLKISFTKLSNFLTTIELNSYPNKQIQLDCCHLIENSTTATLIALVSIRTRKQSAIETTIIDENIDQNSLLSKSIDNIIQYENLRTTISISVILDNQKLTHKTVDFNNDSIENEEEINNPTDCSKCIDNNQNQPKETTHYSNDINTQFLLI